MARSMFDALTDEEKRGTLANPGSASPLGSTLSMKTGAFLHPLLQAAKDKFPKDNPRGRWLGEMLLGDSPQRTGRVAEGQPDQYFHFNRGSGSNVSPEIVDLAGALPIASTLKLAKAAAVPAAMATSAGLLGRAVKGKNFAPTSTDDIGAALLGQRLQHTGALNDAMVAYQGSPHEFDALDPTKIGTGEGAQAYGHGLYVAENRGVAKGYQEGLSSMAGFKINNKSMSIKTESVPHTPGLRRMIPEFRAMSFVEQHGVFEGKAQALSQIRRPEDKKYLNDVLAEIDKLKGVEVEKVQGYLYEIDVPDEDIAKMLDWDAPLSEQPESVRNLIDKQSGRQMDDFVAWFDKDAPYPEGGPSSTKWADLSEADKKIFTRHLSSEGMQLPRSLEKPNETGEQYYWNLSEDAEESSKMLLDNGIPGIKYYDQGSRAAEEGTRNMVLFDDLARRAKVLKRNDEVIAQPSVDEFIGKLLED